MQLTDEMLVQRCLGGDKEAFGFLVDRYKESVFGLAYSKVGNIHDAQDIAQEAFLSAYKNLRQFGHPYKFYSWLYTITANCCKMFFRKQAKERACTEYLEKLPSESLADESLRKHREEEMRQSLMDAIASLPEDTRLAMTLYYIDELSGKEIAEFMGISHSNVRVKLHRGRKLLGKELLEMAERRVGTSKVTLGFTFDILESIKYLTPKPIPKPKSPFIRALPWGAGLVAALVLGIFGGLGINFGGSNYTTGKSIVPPNWVETELFIEKPGLAETASVDEDGKFPIADLPQTANLVGEKSEKRGSAGAGQLPTVEEIAHKMGYIFGDIKDIKFTVKLMGTSGPRVDRYEYKFHDKSRIEMGGLGISVDNGKQNWHYNPNEDSKLIKVYGKRTAAPYIDITLRGLFKLPEVILSDDYDVKLEGAQTIDGQEMLMLRFDSKSIRQTPFYIYADEVITTDFMLFAERSEKKFIRVGIDPKTYLPLYQEVSSHSQYKSRITKTEKFGDVVLPVEDEALTPSGKVKWSNRVENVQLNTGVGDDRFEIPTGSDVIVINENYIAQTREALQEYEERVKSEPNNIALRYTLVEGHRNQNPLIDADALRRHTEKLLELAPDSISAQYEAGEAYLRLDEPKKALVCLQKVASVTPNRREIHSLMGQAYEKIGLIDESIGEYKIELQRFIDAEVWWGTESWWIVGNYYGDRWNHNERGISTKLAVLCRANNQLEQLIEEYQKQIENSPENICLQRLLGDAYYQLGDKQQAAQAYRRMFELIGQKNAIEGSTTSWEFDHRLKELGLHKELADYYHRKFDSGDFSYSELQSLLGLYAHLNETDRMVEIYKEMVQKRGVDIKEQLSSISNIVKSEGLMALLEKYVEKHPQDGMTYKLLADLHLQQGDVDGAIKLYERSTSIDPDNVEASVALGKLYAERLNYDKAAQHYQKASSLRPEEPYYKARLAYAYNRLGRHNEAIAIGQKLTQEYENDPMPMLVLGCVYFNAGKYESAIEEFKKVLQHDESSQGLQDDMNKFLAIAYLKAGKPEAMNLTPWTLGDVLNDCTEEGDYDGMLQMAIVGVKNKQDAWKPMWAQGNLINSFIEAGQFDKLIDAFEQELKNDTDNALVYKMLGYIYESMARRYRQTEKCSEAEAMFQKALTLTADNELRAEIYFHLGDIYQMQKQYDKAIAVYQEIIKLKPKDVDARQQLAHIYERTKQYEEAISIYQELIELDKGSIDVYKKSIERCLSK